MFFFFFFLLIFFSPPPPPPPPLEVFRTHSWVPPTGRWPRSTTAPHPSNSPDNPGRCRPASSFCRTPARSPHPPRSVRRLAPSASKPQRRTSGAHLEHSASTYKRWARPPLATSPPRPAQHTVTGL